MPMPCLPRTFKSLPGALGACLLVSACQTAMPLAGTTGDITLTVTPHIQKAARQVMTLVAPRGLNSIASLDLALSSDEDGNITSKTLTGSAITSPVVFSHLHTNHHYHVAAVAYDVNTLKISDDRFSTTNFDTTAMDDNQAISGGVTVGLLSVLFSGTVSDDAATDPNHVTLIDGHYVTDQPATASAPASATALVAGSGVASSNGVGQIGELASLSNPQQLVVDAAGNVIVADTGNSRVDKIAPDGTLSVLAGQVNGLSGIGTDNAPAAGNSLNLPSGVALGPGPNPPVFIADSSNNCIWSVDNTGTMHLVAGMPGPTPGYADGPGTTAQFNNPGYLVVEDLGAGLFNVYVSDEGNNAIRKIAMGAGPANVSTVIKTANSFGDDLLAGVNAGINGPKGLALDVSGNLFFVDNGNHAVRMIDAARTQLTTVVNVAPPGNPTPNFHEGESDLVQFNSGQGLAIDSARYRLYVADSADHCIRAVDLNNPSFNHSNVITFAGLPQPSNTAPISGYLEGPARHARMHGPTGVALSPTSLYFSDGTDNRVRKIQ